METKTLWEHDSPHASCTHEFASVIAVILLRVLIGYLGIKDDKMIIKDDFTKSSFISINVNRTKNQINIGLFILKKN